MTNGKEQTDSRAEVTIPYAPVPPAPRWFGRRWVWVAGAVALALLVGWGSYLYIKAQIGRSIERGLAKAWAPHAIEAVDEQAWQKVTKGMTKAQVIALLGDSSSKAGPGTMTVGGSAASVTAEFWEYNWTEGLPLFGPSPKAYAVYFAADGTVSAVRRPVGATAPTTMP